MKDDLILGHFVFVKHHKVGLVLMWEFDLYSGGPVLFFESLNI